MLINHIQIQSQFKKNNLGSNFVTQIMIQSTNTKTDLKSYQTSMMERFLQKKKYRLKVANHFRNKTPSYIFLSGLQICLCDLLSVEILYRNVGMSC